MIVANAKKKKNASTQHYTAGTLCTTLRRRTLRPRFIERVTVFNVIYLLIITNIIFFFFCRRISSAQRLRVNRIRSL